MRVCDECVYGYPRATSLSALVFVSISNQKRIKFKFYSKYKHIKGTVLSVGVIDCSSILYNSRIK